MSFAFSQVDPETTGRVDQMPTPVSSYLNESWQQGRHDSAFASIMRMREYSLENGDDGSKMLDPEEASIKYGISHYLSFDEPVRESVARLMNQRKQEEIDRQFVIDNGSSAARTIPGLAANFIGGISNPLDFGSMFIPFVGEERLVAGAALAGRGAFRQGLARGIFGLESFERANIPFPRFMSSMLQGALYQSAAEIPAFLEAKQTGEEYTMNRFLVDVGAGGALAGLFHMALAGASRLWEGLKPETRQAMTQQAMNDFVKDEETDLMKYVNVDENAIMQRVLMEHDPLMRAQAEGRVPLKGIQREVYEKQKLPPLPPNHELVTIERADGTTYQAASGGTWKDLPGKPPVISSVVDDKWSTGSLNAGEKIVEKYTPSETAEDMFHQHTLAEQGKFDELVKYLREINFQTLKDAKAQAKAQIEAFKMFKEAPPLLQSGAMPNP